MLCARCMRRTENAERELDLEAYNIRGIVRRINCNNCNTFLALKLDGEIVDINIPCNDKFGCKWKEVQTNREKLIYYILCQIIYPELDTPKPEELESLYDFVDQLDQIVLRWEGGKAIGFYTIKPKGTEIYSTKEIFGMPVLDTAYIRSEFRGRGIGLEMLTDIVTRFPNEDIGFSKPISKAMLRVLKKFLTNHKEYRLRFWEVADCDINESQQLIWCRVRNRF